MEKPRKFSSRVFPLLRRACTELRFIGENVEAAEEYIAQIARESLGYIYPGEQVYVDISSK